MIRIFTVTAPLGDMDSDAVCATLQAAMDRLTFLHPALREASACGSGGVLTMMLRVSGRDQWSTLRAARKIATSMLRRVKIPTETAVLEPVLAPANSHSLTREQGRSVNHAPKGSRAGAVESGPASADPS